MERRIGRIKRWLDRCAAACEGSLWAAAVAELDCARAEMEETRRALSDRLAGESRVPSSKAPLRVALTSFLLVVLLSHPAGSLRGPERSVSPLFTASGSMVEIVTADEKRLLDALRSPGEDLVSGGGESMPSPSEASSALEEESVAVAESVEEAFSAVRFVRAEALSQTRDLSPRQEPRRDSPPPDGPKTDTEPATEDLLRLLQVGQRALGGEGVTVVH